MPYGENKMYELYYKGLRGKRVSIAQLADGWGVSRKLMVRDFKRWCEANGLDPRDFYERGFRLTGYWAPRSSRSGGRRKSCLNIRRRATRENTTTAEW